MMLSYQKILIFSLLLCINLTMLPAHAQEIIPYEDVISREYNRMRPGDRYTSIAAILSKTFRGKSTEQKNQILGDVRALQQAIHTAWLQAEHDGKRIWQWGYIWKDNNANIQALREHYDDVNTRLQELEWESQSDAMKLFWVSSKYMSIAIAGIMSLYLTQGYLSQEYYQEHKAHGPLEMLLAPAYGGLDIAKIGAKFTVHGMQALGGALLLAGNYGASFFAIKDTTAP